MLKLTSSAPLVVALGLFASACFEEVTLDAHCPPTSEGCETFDFDGDGIPNGQDPDGDNDGVDNQADDFPDDPSCARQNEANCAACGQSCAPDESCVMGACSGEQGSTACGQGCAPWETCVMGTCCHDLEAEAENTLNVCSNGCDDDGNGYIDCNDFACKEYCH